MQDKYKAKSQLIAELQQLRKDCEQYREFHFDSYMLKEMITRSPISIQVLDNDGYSVSVNEAHTALFEAQPPPDYNMFSDPLLLEQELQDDFKMLKNGEAVFFKDTWYNAHFYNPDLTDKMVWVKTCAFPLLDPGGKPNHFVIMHEDITIRKRLEKEVEEKNDMLEAQKQWMHNNIEQERKKLADMVHKTFGHKLTEGKIKLENIQAIINDKLVNNKIQQVIDLCDELNRCSQDITEEFRQYTEIVFDFIKDMHRMADQFANDNKIPVIFNSGHSLKLSAKQAMLLHQILEEALTNISRHAKASHVTIDLNKKGNKAEFIVIDDGIGIKSKHIRSQRAFGLMSMRENADALGGSFSIGPHGKKGCEIYITFPLKK